MSIETPQERHLRRHEEDKKENPDKHFINKNSYSFWEVMNLCPHCCINVKDNYELNFETEIFYKKGS